MGIITSALIGLGVGGATWRIMRFKNGEEEFSLYNDYTDYAVPIVVRHDGSKPQMPWAITPFSTTLNEIKDCVANKKKFEGYDLRKFHLSKLEPEDQVTFGRAIHEAHLHTRHGKRCKLYLRGDKFVLEVSNPIR